MAAHRTPAEVGIYIHIPFCEKKCFYCDFYSTDNHSQRTEFIKSLTKEIELFSKNHPKLKADTIFFGGGTPSLLTPDELETILDSLHSRFDISDDSEFTMECNPGTIDTGYLPDYRRLGANRLSFGVQSFFDDELSFLSRIHNSEEAVKAVRKARDTGFENINIDLIYGLPMQTKDRLIANLQKAISLETEHISAYGLIVEPGTPLFTAVTNGRVTPVSDSTEAEMYETVMAFLEEKGYRHYEVSNYSRPGYECKHNLKYWDGREYVGFGPSAHSHLNHERWGNIANLNGYIAALSKNQMPVSAVEELGRSQLLDEFVLLQLRQGKLDLKTLREDFGIALEPDFLLRMKQTGYVEIHDDKVYLSKRGFTVCDEIAEEILATHSVPV